MGGGAVLISVRTRSGLDLVRRVMSGFSDRKCLYSGRRFRGSILSERRIFSACVRCNVKVPRKGDSKMRRPKMYVTQLGAPVR